MRGLSEQLGRTVYAERDFLLSVAQCLDVSMGQVCLGGATSVVLIRFGLPENR